jgi:hypothetical protein
MNVHTFHTWDAKMRRKKSRLKSIKVGNGAPFPKGGSVWIPYGAFPTEFPYGFQYEFHKEHFIPPTASSSGFLRILGHSHKLRVPATTH